MILPLGTLTKTEVREIGPTTGFFQIAARKDSLGVCFCPGDYRSFLKKRLGESVFQRDFTKMNPARLSVSIKDILFIP